jgi:diguanylate cyclase (GGDEF)-like protein
MFLRLLEYLSHQSKARITVFSLIIVALVTSIDYANGYEFRMKILYTIPLVCVSAGVSKYLGLLFVVITTLIATIVDLSLLSASHSNLNRLVVYWNNFVYCLTAIILVWLTSSLAESIKREKLLSRTDFLTGIANRKFLFEFLKTEIYRCRRNHQNLTIAYLDCDDFKVVNDKLGHQAGDDLLYLVANTIKDNIRTTDLVARLGGDEFVVVLPNTGQDIAFQTVSRLQNILSSQIQHYNWAVTFSIGVATFNSVPESADDIIRRSDELMFSVKTSGKGRFEHRIFN